MSESASEATVVAGVDGCGSRRTRVLTRYEVLRQVRLLKARRRSRWRGRIRLQRVDAGHGRLGRQQFDRLAGVVSNGGESGHLASLGLRSRSLPTEWLLVRVVLMQPHSDGVGGPRHLRSAAHAHSPGASRMECWVARDGMTTYMIRPALCKRIHGHAAIGDVVRRSQRATGSL